MYSEKFGKILEPEEYKGDSPFSIETSAKINSADEQ